MDKVQPTEYRTVTWGKSLTDDKVMVIHLLMVRPCMAGKGIASSLVKYAMELAKRNSCEAIRLDTGSQNIPAQPYLFIRNWDFGLSQMPQ